MFMSEMAWRMADSMADSRGIYCFHEQVMDHGELVQNHDDGGPCRIAFTTDLANHLMSVVQKEIELEGLRFECGGTDPG